MTEKAPLCARTDDPRTVCQIKYRGNPNLSTVRIEKINAEIQKCLYEIITQRMKNPNVTEMVSVSHVETANDLKHAKVSLSVYSKDAEKTQATYRAIVDSAGFIRRELSRMVTFRTVPELHFSLDDSMAYSEHISEIINRIHAEEKGGRI